METLLALAIGFPTGTAAVLGFLYWRSRKARRKLEKRVYRLRSDNAVYRQRGSALSAALKLAEQRIETLETRLAEIDPGAAFDGFFGGMSSSGSGESGPN